MRYSKGQRVPGHDSVFVGFEPCPKCQEKGYDTAGDNLGRFDDGHGYCFSCQYLEPSEGMKMLERVFGASQGQEGVKPAMRLPEDASASIDAKALNWLAQFDISRDEIIQNGLRWSGDRQWLCFPYRDGAGNLIAYQARAFNRKQVKITLEGKNPPVYLPLKEGHDQKKAHEELMDTIKDVEHRFKTKAKSWMVDPNGGSKWLTFGNHEDLMHIVGLDALSDKIVLVEDIISAIKVGRHVQCMPLFGSVISKRRLMRLRNRVKHVILWLDSDKYKYCLEAAEFIPLLNLECTVLYTQEDPKFYDDDDIKQKVGV